MNLKRAFKNITPFIIIPLLAVLAFIYLFITKGEGPAGVGFIFAGSGLALIAIMLLVDVVLKRIVKIRLLWVWLTEAILLLAIIYYLIVT